MGRTLGRVSLVGLAALFWLPATSPTQSPGRSTGQFTGASDSRCEPRTPISALPFVIRRSGSYYLTRPLTGVAGSHGISIEASDVTLDLNGFSLRGVPGSLSGVWASAGRQNLTILDGVVRDWGADGVDLSGARSIAFVGLQAANNFGAGLRAGGGSSASRCTVTGNGALFGANLDLGPASLASNCIARTNTGTGIRVGSGGVVSGCATEGHIGYDGIAAAGDSIVRDCTTSGGRIFVGARSSVIDCKVSGSSLGGIRAGAGSVVEHCSVSNANSIGIRVDSDSVVKACVSAASGANGIDAGPRSTVEDCRTSNSSFTGFVLGAGAIALRCVSDGDVSGIDAGAGCSVVDSRVSNSLSNGISVRDDCVVSGNVVRGNLGSGIRVGGSGNRVESNQMNDNGSHGVEVPNPGNYLFRNAASGNPAGNYDIGAGNAYGVIVSVAGGGPFTADPWSNLEY